MTSELVTAINKLGAYIERIPPEGIKALYQDQIMKRLAMILIQIDEPFMTEYHEVSYENYSKGEY